MSFLQRTVWDVAYVHLDNVNLKDSKRIRKS